MLTDAERDGSSSAPRPPARERPGLGLPASAWWLAAAASLLICLAFDRATRSWDLFLLASNALPWLTVWVLSVALLRRPYAALLLTAALAAVFYGGHDVKLRYLALPVVPADFAALAHVVRTPELYARYLNATALIPLAAVVGLVLCIRRERARLPFCGTVHLLWIVVATAATTTFWGETSVWKSAYARDVLPLKFWSPAEAAAEHGAMAHFMVLLMNTSSSLPDIDPLLLDEARVRLQARLHGPPPTSRREAPDIVIYQSESFFDPADLRGLESESFIPHLKRLSARARHGRLRVPTFGGLTTRTEFEFLTGFPLESSPEIQFPYQGLLHRRVAALPWALRRIGYRATAIHPYHAHFYNRDRAYPLLGFQAFLDQSGFTQADLHGYHVSDLSLNRLVQATLDAAPGQFLFVVTAENHGPWDDARPLDEARLPDPAALRDLDEAISAPFRRYLHHLSRSDLALASLVEWLDARERHTVLLFYGDHLPALREGFDALGFRDGMPANRQTVPWILLDNRSHTSDRIDMDVSQLSAWLLAHLELDASAPFAEVEGLRRASAGVSDATRMAWQRQVVADAFLRDQDPIENPWKPSRFASLHAWGPRTFEAAGSDDAPQVGIWMRFETPPEPDWIVRLGEHRMPVVDRDGDVMVALLSGAAARSVLDAPGKLPLRLRDPGTRSEQLLADVVVRPRAPRKGSWFGIGGGPFCEVIDWGPREVGRPGTEHRHADGSVGLWVKAGCIPRDARLALDATPFETAIEDDVATAALGSEHFDTEASIRVSLVLATGERMEIGVLRSNPRG